MFKHMADGRLSLVERIPANVAMRFAKELGYPTVPEVGGRASLVELPVGSLASRAAARALLAGHRERPRVYRDSEGYWFVVVHDVYNRTEVDEAIQQIEEIRSTYGATPEHGQQSASS